MEDCDLLDAVLRDDIYQFDDLIKEGESPNSIYLNKTIICHLLEKSKPNFLSKLLEYDVCKNDNHIMDIAINKGNKNFVIQLLEHGFKVHSNNLESAVLKGDEEIISILVKAIDPVDAWNSIKSSKYLNFLLSHFSENVNRRIIKSIIDRSIECNNIDVIDALSDALNNEKLRLHDHSSESQIDELFIRRELQIAEFKLTSENKEEKNEVVKHHEEIDIEELILNGSMDFDKNILLKTAIETRSKVVRKIILKEEFSRKEYSVALIHSVSLGYFKLSQLFIDRGADVNYEYYSRELKKDISPVIAAIDGEHFAILKYLVSDKKAIINENIYRRSLKASDRQIPVFLATNIRTNRKFLGLLITDALEQRIYESASALLERNPLIDLNVLLLVIRKCPSKGLEMVIPSADKDVIVANSFLLFKEAIQSKEEQCPKVRILLNSGAVADYDTLGLLIRSLIFLSSSNHIESELLKELIIKIAKVADGRPAGKFLIDGSAEVLRVAVLNGILFDGITMWKEPNSDELGLLIEGGATIGFPVLHSIRLIEFRGLNIYDINKFILP